MYYFKYFKFKLINKRLRYKNIKMGIPRFYRWLRNRYPQIRMDLQDQTKQLPIIDNLYLDFNGLIYRCIREFQCFLKNKFDPLTEEDIFNRVYEYLLVIVEKVNPKKMIYIAFDGVAPRAKINQSRDRRFKAGKQKKQFREFLAKIQVQDKQIFQQNSISPGTHFLTDMCQRLKKHVMELIQNQWKHLDIFFSDCLTPGEGEHKIMEFLRNSKRLGVFNEESTHCIYSADADVLLLSLATEIHNIVLIREDSMKLQYGFTAQCFRRKYPQPQFEYVFLNILRQYLTKEFQHCMIALKMKTLQPIINDFILLMAFVGNDFLPLQFCFSIKQSHMQALFTSYKEYLLQTKVFINNEGTIQWQNILKLLQICKQFEADMLQEMIRNKKSNIAGKRGRGLKTEKEEQKKEKAEKKEDESESEEKDEEQVANFEVENKKIVKGKSYYYQTRFNLVNYENHDTFKDIIIKYAEGLQFYCEYYFKGVPSWSWYYPYHYTPLLADLYDYISFNKVQIKFPPTRPYDPFMALMMMMPIQSFNLLPDKIIDTMQSDENKDFMKDYFPQNFRIDVYEPIRYNRRALIKFLPEEKVREIYSKIARNEYSQKQRERNSQNNTILLRNEKGCVMGKQIVFGRKQQEQQIVAQLKDYKITRKIKGARFPSLEIFGDFHINEKGKIVASKKYKYSGPNELVYFNNFLGYVEDFQPCSEQMKSQFETAYEKIGILGKCENYFRVKQVRLTCEPSYISYAKTNRQVYIPDFALFKAPKYEYLPEISNIDPQNLYQVGQKVVIIGDRKYFGYVGTITKNDKKDSATIKLCEPSYFISTKIEENQQQFYTLNSVSEQLAIHKQVILTILDQVILLPRTGKKYDADLYPISVNFGLNVLNRNLGLVCPYYVRCQMEYENSSNKEQIFDHVEISESCLIALRQYANKFEYFVDYLEEMIVNKHDFSFKKGIKASNLFSEPSNQNMFKEFINLYSIQVPGYHCSIYSKMANKQCYNLDFQPSQRLNSEIELPYSDFISKDQAMLCPPCLNKQPEFHDIGDRIILLKTLQSGYIVGIDDYSLYLRVKSRKKTTNIDNVVKCGFMDVFNEKWMDSLLRKQGRVWPMNISYYSPTHYTKAL